MADLQESSAPQAAVPKRPVPDFSDESASEEVSEQNWDFAGVQNWCVRNWFLMM